MRKILLIIGLVMMFGLVGVKKVNAFCGWEGEKCCEEENTGKLSCNGDAGFFGFWWGGDHSGFTCASDENFVPICKDISSYDINSCLVDLRSGVPTTNYCNLTEDRHARAINEDIVGEKGFYEWCGCYTDAGWEKVKNNNKADGWLGRADGWLEGNCLAGNVCNYKYVCDKSTSKCVAPETFGTCVCDNSGSVKALDNKCTNPALAKCITYKDYSYDYDMHGCQCLDPEVTTDVGTTKTTDVGVTTTEKIGGVVAGACDGSDGKGKIGQDCCLNNGVYSCTENHELNTVDIICVNNGSRNICTPMQNQDVNKCKCVNNVVDYYRMDTLNYVGYGCNESEGKVARCTGNSSCECSIADTGSEKVGGVTDESKKTVNEKIGVSAFKQRNEPCSDTEPCVPGDVCGGVTRICEPILGVLNNPCEKGNCVPGLNCVNNICVRDPNSICGEFGENCCPNKWVWGEKSCVRLDLMCANNKCVMDCLPNQPDCGRIGKACFGSGHDILCDPGLICDTSTNICISDNRSNNVGDAVLPTYDSKDYISPFKFKDADMGTVIGKVIGYVYIFAGFGLLLVLLMGGFAVMTSAGAPEKAKMGYDRITQGVTGFLLIFVSYLIVLVVQATFKIKIFF